MGLLSSVPDVSKFQNISQVLRGCCADGLCAQHSRDPLFHKPLRECWSLSTSQEFRGELPALDWFGPWRDQLAEARLRLLERHLESRANHTVAAVCHVSA